VKRQFFSGTGRPYFVSRGMKENLTMDENAAKLIIPCVINNPVADIYLLKKWANVRH